MAPGFLTSLKKNFYGQHSSLFFRSVSDAERKSLVRLRPAAVVAADDEGDAECCELRAMATLGHPGVSIIKLFF